MLIIDPAAVSLISAAVVEKSCTVSIAASADVLKQIEEIRRRERERSTPRPERFSSIGEAAARLLMPVGDVPGAIGSIALQALVMPEVQPLPPPPSLPDVRAIVADYQDRERAHESRREYELERARIRAREDHDWQRLRRPVDGAAQSGSSELTAKVVPIRREFAAQSQSVSEPRSKFEAQCRAIVEVIEQLGMSAQALPSAGRGTKGARKLVVDRLAPSPRNKLFSSQKTFTNVWDRALKMGVLAFAGADGGK